MSDDTIKKQFVSKYLEIGEEKLYSFLISHSVKKLSQIDNGTYKGIYPDLELLDYCDRFIILYRREGEEAYLDIARILRKAAHKIYRIMLKKNMTPKNGKFLNLV